MLFGRGVKVTIGPAHVGRHRLRCQADERKTGKFTNYSVESTLCQQLAIYFKTRILIFPQVIVNSATVWRKTTLSAVRFAWPRRLVGFLFSVVLLPENNNDHIVVKITSPQWPVLDDITYCARSAFAYLGLRQKLYDCSWHHPTANQQPTLCSQCALLSFSLVYL